MSVSVGLHRWDQFPEKNGPWGWGMAKLRKMEWLALAGSALPPNLDRANPAFKPRKRGSSPDKKVPEIPQPATARGPSGRAERASAPQATWKQSGEKGGSVSAHNFS